jgi:hypothetical protein
MHGEFLQTPEHHLRGYGCNQCGYEIASIKLRKPKKCFLKQANVIHGNKYDYSKFVYTNDKTKGIIICPTHGEFLQTPGKHLVGHGCMKCSSNISKKSQQWLDKLNIPRDFREKTLVINSKVVKTDALDEKNKIVYEFYGDFWHKNPKIYDKNGINVVNKKTFGELYLKTVSREKLIKSAGYEIIFIWESDFNI